MGKPIDTTAMTERVIDEGQTIPDTSPLEDALDQNREEPVDVEEEAYAHDDPHHIGEEEFPGRSNKSH